MQQRGRIRLAILLCQTATINPVNKVINIGLQERFVPLIDSRVICYCTFSERQERNGFRDLGLTPDEHDRWRFLVGRSCITGYPNMMDALGIASNAETWACEMVMRLMEMLEVIVQPCWYPTLDGVPACNDPPKSLSGPGPDDRESPWSHHPFHYESQVLDGTDEESCTQKAARWYKMYERECVVMNKGALSKCDFRWIMNPDTDPRIIKAASFIK